MNCLKPFHSDGRAGEVVLGADLVERHGLDLEGGRLYMNTRSGNSPARFMSANTRWVLEAHER